MTSHRRLAAAALATLALIPAAFAGLSSVATSDDAVAQTREHVLLAKCICG